jgi:hypothetical protein
MRHENNFVTGILVALGMLLGVATARPMENFQLDRKTAEPSLREIIKNFSKDGTTADEAVRGDIDFIREQNKLKTVIPLG